MPVKSVAAHWPVLIALVTAAALLLVFDRVVRQAVQQGVMRQTAQRERSHAIWRCKALQAAQARADCRQRLL